MRQKINWNEHIEIWKESGLSKAEYCRQNELNKYSFYGAFKSKPEVSESLLQLPFAYDPGKQEKQPLFEIHLCIPFSFRFRIDLRAGKDS